VFSPNILTFTVEQDGTAPSQSLDLDTSDSGVAGYTITDDAVWLLVNPTSGSTPDILTVSIDAAGLSPGTYTGTITAASSGYTDGTVDVTLFVTGSSIYDLLLSASSNRSSPVPLEGETVSGTAYIFTNPDEGVSRVSFYLDDSEMIGSPIRIENIAPYDFAGTAGSNANPFETINLSNASHVITALIELNDGGLEIVNAAFTVNNGRTSFLTDDFVDGNANGWNEVPDDGQSSVWEVVGEIYQQQVPIINPGTFSGSYHLGKYSIYNTGLNWFDYRFSVDILPLAERGDDIGVMFRYQDDDNYYRLSISARYGYTRLEKKVDGFFIPLLTDARGYNLGLPLTIEVEADRDFIFVYVDDDPVFGIKDSSLRWGSVGLYTRAEAEFDNVVVDSIDSNPSIVISTPIAYSVTKNDGFQASALARNIPVGGWVEFLLDGASCGGAVEDSEGLYTVQCSSLSQGEHIMKAAINEGGFELSDDINESVGTSGDNYIAVGDSWTNGFGDTFSLDNKSLNGKIISLQGYQASLSDLLTSTDQHPIIIFNEGIGGDESYDAAYDRIDSIIDRNPTSNKVLILLGTNDAAVPVLSGLGCSGSSCNGTYKQNMQVLINKIIAKQVFVALVPPAFTSANPLDSTRNQLIQEYNAVITSELTNIEPERPDFFSFFLSESVNRFSLFIDEIHLNSLGYLVMAYLWHNALTGSTDLPFILEDLTPSTVAPYLKQNLIEAGDEYYVDESFTINNIPSVLENGRWIMTANSDKANTSGEYLSFNVDRNVTVYVAYDSGASIPNWLNSNFYDTGLNLGTSNPDVPSMDLYVSNTAMIGDISLGGNRADGANGAANYIAIIVEN
jgi:lysophospholipase L1-like esterase